jgi:colanic acid/amylovoran biosynthesis glycosyltransferase
VDLPSQVAEHRDAGVVRCVAVGRLVPKKAPLLLLEAFRRAAVRDSRLTLDIVGDGPLMTDARRYIAQHSLQGQVKLHGRQSHPDALAMIRSADVLLHHAITSPVDGDTEGQPLAIMEAMAAGVTVIATDHAGIPEVVDDRVNGRLVAEHDVAGMAQALLEVACDPDERRRLGRAARATIVERHSHDRARQTLLGLFGLDEHQAVVR